jgi:DNA helicase-2/ATP-dependent DNA helicase PcrA
MTHTQDLNPQQLKAVTTNAPHTLVLAGAGSGKTKTIIARASHLIATGTEPKRILILAFTRRAAREIEARVALSLGRQASHGLNASTFHSWCAHLLRRAPKLFGFSQFSVIDRDDQIQMFRLARGKRTKKEFPSAADICDLYSYARNTRLKLSLALEKLMPEEVDHKDAIADVMKAYEQRKRSNNYLDYDDILDVVAKGLHQSADIQKWVGQQYDHVLVDEMQDTNPIQWEILRPLADHAKLFCVGDDAQSIYGFRGADCL